MVHKFNLRQRVQLLARSHGAKTSESFEVTRQMPADPDGIPTYRIRSSSGERAVRESDIALSA